MQYGTFLKVGVVSDGDAVIVGADNGVKPNAGTFADGYITDDSGIRCDKRILMTLWDAVPQFVFHGCVNSVTRATARAGLWILF